MVSGLIFTYPSDKLSLALGGTTTASANILLTGANGTPQALLDISGEAKGQALVQINETGNQDIFVASQAGNLKFSISNAGATSQSGDLTLFSANGATIKTQAFSPLTIGDSITGPIVIGNATAAKTITVDSGTGAISIGNSNNAKTVTIGNGNAGDTITIGSGGGTASTVNIATATTADTINIGTGGSNGDTISIGTGTAASKVIFFQRTAAVAADFTTNGQFALGAAGGTATTSGRIWVRANNLNFRFNSTGNTADYSEYLQQEDTSEPGDVMVLSSSTAQSVKRSTQAYDQNVLGVISQYGTSNNQGTCWDEVSCDKGADPHWANVGMLGQVYTKISTENGAVNPGDPLTTSSVKGVAMKATKTGRIVGYALDYFDGTVSGHDVFEYLPIAPVTDVTLPPRQVAGEATTPVTVKAGKILILLQASWFEPDAPPLDIGEVRLVASNSGSLDLPLTYNVQNSLTGVEVRSNIVKKDAVIGNLEVGSQVAQAIKTKALTVTDQASINDLAIASLRPIDGAININLADEHGQLIVKGVEGAPVFTVDAFGNATFAGTVLADNIKANKIEGLQVLTKELIAQELRLVDSKDGNSTSSSSGSITGVATFDRMITFLQGLFVKGEAVFEGTLNVLGVSTFRSQLIVNPDTAGIAVIPKLATTVDVNFEKEYTNIPIVTISLSLPEATDSAWLSDGAKAAVANVKTGGFTIVLDQPVPRDMEYNWVAFGVTDRKKTMGRSLLIEPTIQVMPTSPTSPNLPTPMPTVVPTPTPLTLDQSPVSAASASPTPTIITPTPFAGDILGQLTVKDTDVGFVRLRSSPAIDSGELDQVPSSTQLPYYEVLYSWYRVVYDGHTGWVSGTYVTTP